MKSFTNYELIKEKKSKYFKKFTENFQPNS